MTTSNPSADTARNIIIAVTEGAGDHAAALIKDASVEAVAIAHGRLIGGGVESDTASGKRAALRYLAADRAITPAFTTPDGRAYYTARLGRGAVVHLTSSLSPVGHPRCSQRRARSRMHSHGVDAAVTCKKCRKALAAMILADVEALAVAGDLGPLGASPDVARRALADAPADVVVTADEHVRTTKAHADEAAHRAFLNGDRYNEERNDDLSTDCVAALAPTPTPTPIVHDAHIVTTADVVVTVADAQVRQEDEDRRVDLDPAFDALMVAVVADARADRERRGAPRAADYTDAPATALLAVRCLICGRPLLDAVSVEVGIGPVCRGRVDLDADTSGLHRREVNALVHEAALAATPADRRIEIADEVRAFGFVALADRIVERFLRRASLSVRIAHNATGIRPVATVTVTDGRLVIDTPYDPDLVADVKKIGGRRWDGDSKTWSVPDTSTNRDAVADALADAFEGAAANIDGKLCALDVHADLFAHVAAIAAPAATVAAVLTREGDRVFVAFDCYRADAIDMVKAIRGRRWHADRLAWSVPDTPGARRGLDDGLVALGLAFTTPTTPPAAVAPLPASGVSRAAMAAMCVDNALIKGAREYQAKGVHWLATFGMDANGALLADDMGLGKTMQAILALPLQHARALVVCPKSLTGNWRNEVARWRPDLTPVVVSSKTWRLPAEGEVVICNYAGLPKRLAVKVEGDRFPVAELDADEVRALASTVLVLDEAEAVTNWKAARTARVRNLRHGARAAWALTGTPMSSRPQQLWGLLATLGMSKATFGNFDRFVGMMGGERKRFGGYTFDARYVDTDQVATSLRRAVLRRTKADALPELPPKIHTEITVATPRALRRELDAAFASWPEAERGDLPGFEGMAIVRRQLAESRIDAMVDRVNLAETHDAPLVVYSAHRAPIDALRGREGWRVITGAESADERTDAVAAFQRGDLRGIGITSAGSRGITLTAASRMLFVDMPWTPAEVDQVEDRICRIGQHAAGLHYERLVSDHPLDLHVLKILDSKRAMLAATVDAAIAPTTGPTGHVVAR